MNALERGPRSITAHRGILNLIADSSICFFSSSIPLVDDTFGHGHTVYITQRASLWSSWNVHGWNVCTHIYGNFCNFKPNYEKRKNVICFYDSRAARLGLVYDKSLEWFAWSNITVISSSNGMEKNLLKLSKSPLVMGRREIFSLPRRMREIVLQRMMMIFNHAEKS